MRLPHRFARLFNVRLIYEKTYYCQSEKSDYFIFISFQLM